VSWDAARRGQGGWGYAILTFDRKDVKKGNGVDLAPAKPKPEGPRSELLVTPNSVGEFFAKWNVRIHSLGMDDSF
jgi:hypothetical protein